MERRIPLSEIAKAHGVTYQTAKSWTRRGLKAFRVGGRVYVTESALREFEEPVVVGGPEPEAERAVKAFYEAFHGRRQRTENCRGTG